MKWLSIIILTLNEEKNIRKIIDNVRQLELIEEAEIIVSDGNSTDSTLEFVDDNIKIVVSESNRSRQMKEAIQVAKGSVYWFLHADMVLPKDGLRQIKRVVGAGYGGGGFANIFDNYNTRIKRLGVLLNLRFLDRREQSDKGIFYGDNGIFVSKEYLNKIGGIPQQEIMEDYELSVHLRESDCKMYKINNAKIIVSSRRHIEDGFVKTRLNWIIIRQLYKIGIRPSLLSKLYRDKR